MNIVARDNLHFTFREIDGYNKFISFVISEREPGKSTALWLDKIYKAYQEGKTSIVIRRRIADITDIYIDDSVEIIKKFIDPKFTVHYKRTSLKDGIVDLKKWEKVGENDEGDVLEERIFCRIIGLSNPLSRLKSLVLRNLKYIIFDEFICNPNEGEKYLTGEAFKFFELVNTFQRESSGLKCYFCGNPYSLYNPYFLELGVDTSKLKRGAILKGDNYVVQCYEMKQELRDLILSRNPLYKFDNAYTKYAFDGININDSNIRLEDKPVNSFIEFVFKVSNKYLTVYKNYNYNEDKRYYIELSDDVSKKHEVFCFDIKELVNRAVLASNIEKQQFHYLKACFRRRLVVFNSIECYYLFEEVFLNL